MAPHQGSRPTPTPAQHLEPKPSARDFLCAVDAVGEGLSDREAVRLGLDQAVVVLHGLGGLLHLVEAGGRGLRLMAHTSLSPTLLEAWQELALDDAVPPARAVRQDTMVRTGRGEPGPVCLPSGTGLVSVPLPGAHGPLGAITVVTVTPDEAETGRRQLDAVARWIAARLRSDEGSQAATLQSASEERTVRTADLTRALAAAVTGQDVIDAVEEHLRPLFDATGITIWNEEGEHPVLLGAVGMPQEFLKLISAVPVEHNTPPYRALRTGVPVYVSSPQEYIRNYPHLSDIAERARSQTWAYLPMVTSGRSVGVLCVSYAQPHTFTSDERTLFTAVSGLVAQALERGRLYDTEHRRARELQRGLLPQDLPAVPAVTAAARYLPAGEGTEVGGDWYDVVSLSGGRVALVVGDVMGHGLSQAVTMGRLRTVVHTLADLDLPVEEMFIHLNDVVTALGADFYATCLYAVYDPTNSGCTILTAGHPPPAVVHPDGTVRFPELPLNPPLGAASPPFESGALRLPPDSLLALYTDGLIESPERSLDLGMALMARQLGSAQVLAAQADPTAARLDGVCDSLIATVRPAPQQADDDAVLLLASVHPLPSEDIGSWQLPADPRAASQARGHVRDQLARWGLHDLAMTTELLVSELVGNVVRHVGGPSTLRLLRSKSLICEVTDNGSAMPRIRRAADTDEGGRGLQLVAALAERWGARYTPSGKCIWTEQALPEPV